MTQRIVLATATIALLVSLSPRADVIFDNGMPRPADEATGQAISDGIFSADDVMVTQTSDATEVRFWVLEETSPGTRTWDSTVPFLYTFYNDGTAGPGSVYKSGTAKNITTPIPPTGGPNDPPITIQATEYNRVGYSFQLEQAVRLIEGSTYWLSLYLGTSEVTGSPASFALFWDASATQTGNTTRYAGTADGINPTTPWFASNVDMAFQLRGNAVPTPAPLLLVATGLAGILLRRRSTV